MAFGHGRVRADEREACVLRLFESKDINALGAIADFARQRKVVESASYINYSSYCILSCQFCAFARKKRDTDGFQRATEQIVEKAREALKLGITVLHIVGGLHPSLPFSYYVEMLRALSALNSPSGSTGAADLHGKIIEVHIFHMAGATSPQLQTEAAMVKAIREAGRVPVQRGTFYEPIKVWDDVTRASAKPSVAGKSKVLEDKLATA